jgi:hypothetical protein
LNAYNRNNIKAKIDRYIDKEILPQTQEMRIEYDQLFWDANNKHAFWPFHSFIQQDKEEFRQLCYFILDKEIRSYLEVGVHTGVQVRLLNEIFNFDKVAIANLDELYFPKLPSDIKPSGFRVDGVFNKYNKFYLGEFPNNFRMFIGNSQSEEYAQWRRSIGHFDFTFIDADHSYQGIKKDFELNTVGVPHKYIGFHDIGEYQEGFIEVKKLWDELVGNKVEFLSYTEPPIHMGIGIYWE